MICNVGGKPNFTLRITVGLFGQFLILVLVPSSYFLYLTENQNYFLILISTAVVASFTALIDSCAIAFASHYPTRIQEALQLGIGYSTLIGSIVDLFLLWCHYNPPMHSGLFLVNIVKVFQEVLESTRHSN